ncbi:hypothetical protein JHK82_055289 [Glycine max]|nr:hypothetical protein JHK85_056102 [Glycine max]KAG5076594.1 hypothetical protein JHK82_055289 [Glycine max]
MLMLLEGEIGVGVEGSELGGDGHGGAGTIKIFNGVFLKGNKATMNMLHIVEPYVTYGYPNLKSVKELLYKRGYGKLNKQRTSLIDNSIIEQAIDVSKCQEKVRETPGNIENSMKLEAAETKLQDLKTNMAILGKEAAAAMAAVEAQQQRLKQNVPIINEYSKYLISLRER